MNARLSHLILLSDSSVQSFCSYTSHESFEPRISVDNFKKVIDFVLANKMVLNILKSQEALSPAYSSLLDKVEHVIIEPLTKESAKNSSIKIIETESETLSESLINQCQESVFIIRMSLNEMEKLSNIIQMLMKKALRINLVLKDIENASRPLIEKYKLHLLKVVDDLMKVSLPEIKSGLEMNFLTDRIFLKTMKNCNAGINHITIALNMKFYLCPGFYYDQPEDDIGNIDSGILIKNEKLLKLEYSPICGQCDCYHCSRCIYLNKKTTKEINTPSYQQCLISHAERNASGELLQQLQSLNQLMEFTPIKQIAYSDPFELIQT